MTRVLMIRHGQSLANVQRFFAGHLNSPLTDLGVEQAQLAAGYIHQNYTVDRVYASDLDRAYVTGKAVADLYGLPVTADRRLREISAGDWEGVLYDELPNRFPASYGVWLHDIGNAVSDCGESVAMLQQRVCDAMGDICVANPDKTVVVATHATPIRAFQCFCEGRALSTMKDIPWVSNASISSFVYDNGNFEIESISYEGHLGQLKSVLPRNC